MLLLFVSIYAYIYSNMAVLMLKIQHIFSQKTFSLKVNTKTSVSICFRVCSYLAGLVRLKQTDAIAMLVWFI